MKKAFLSFFFTTFVMIGCSQFVDIGYFGNENNKISFFDLSEVNTGDFDVQFRFQGSNRVCMSISHSRWNNSFQTFVSSLIQMREKFAEWKTIAEQNNVTNLQKTMTNVVFSYLSFTWVENDGIIYLSYGNSFSPLFVVSDNGKCSVKVSGQIRDNKYPEFEQVFSFSFSSLEQIDHFIQLLDYNSMKKISDDKISEEKHKKDLFPD